MSIKSMHFSKKPVAQLYLWKGSRGTEGNPADIRAFLLKNPKE